MTISSGTYGGKGQSSPPVYDELAQKDEVIHMPDADPSEYYAPIAELSQAVSLGGHVGSLDGLRGVACIFALLHHIDLNNAFVGHYGVTIFFVLSGFLISGILAKGRADVHQRRDSLNYLVSFYTARIVRLIPAQLTLIVGSYFWLKHMNPAFYSDDNLTRAYIRILTSTEDFKGQHHPFQNCWSLAIEEWSYILLSFLMLLLPVDRTVRLATFATIITTFYATKVYIISTDAPASLFPWQDQTYLGFPLLNTSWEFGFVTNAWKIFLGAFFRLMPWPSWLFKCRKTAVILALTMICTIQYSGDYLHTHGWPSVASRSALVDPIVALLAGFTIITSIGGNFILENQTLAYVGRVSYSWYLWQWPLIDSINWGSGVWAKTGATGVAFLFAHLSTTYVEEPISRAYRARRRAKANRPIPA